MIWDEQWREDCWARLGEPWDIVVVGGGVTGAGIFHEAARLGQRVLLIEQKDFAWGTSSRSSKLVHGGLRYLKEGQIGLTRDSVHERQQLLKDAPGLVESVGILLATYERDKIGRLVYGAGLSIYDLLALQWSHKYYRPRDFQMLAPHIETTGLKGGFQYQDAQTDDARLVLRLIREGVMEGEGRAFALNYVAALELIQNDDSQVQGILLRDETSGDYQEVAATVVINATGAWADFLRGQIVGERTIRPLRGSHLVFPRWRLPVAQVIAFLHPVDQRPVLIMPWEGVTLVGTTDLDHPNDLNEEPAITPGEVQYLMAAADSEFPSLELQLDDVIGSFAGVRPVIGSGKVDPSEESRDHEIWSENGLITITGGKLTTFRLVAHEVLREARDILPEIPEVDPDIAIFADAGNASAGEDIAPAIRNRLLGRYGRDAAHLIAAAPAEEMTLIPGTRTTWAEVRWGARAEAVQHLDDLLLRRVRLGLLLPHGGVSLMPRIQSICREELGWSVSRWQQEEADYLALWQAAYSLPPYDQIPDWRPLLHQAAAARSDPMRQRSWRSPIAAGLLVMAALMLLAWFWRTRSRTGG